MSRISNLLRKCRDDLLKQGACSIEEVIRCAEARYRGELLEERDRLLQLALRREVKDLMREATGDAEDDGKTEMVALLPGLEAPRAIAVPTENGEYKYVLFASATWTELLKARQEREANYLRAGQRLRDFDLKLEALRPYMQYSDNVTVADACALLARKVA